MLQLCGYGPGQRVTIELEAEGDRLSNVVLMGMGEPFHNYDASISAIHRLMNDLGIGARHITVSTCGLIAGIDRFTHEPEHFTLAISLHSAVQATRDRLMPGMHTISLRRLRTSLVEYATASGRRPSLEYALIDGVNDTDAELAALVAFCRGLLVHVNLIPVNPVAESGFDRSQADRVQVFNRGLEAAGIEVSLRAERGADIDAACGQLRQREESL